MVAQPYKEVEETLKSVTPSVLTVGAETANALVPAGTNPDPKAKPAPTTATTPTKPGQTVAPQGDFPFDDRPKVPGQAAKAAAPPALSPTVKDGVIPQARLDQMATLLSIPKDDKSRAAFAQSANAWATDKPEAFKKFDTALKDLAADPHNLTTKGSLTAAAKAELVKTATTTTPGAAVDLQDRAAVKTLTHFAGKDGAPAAGPAAHADPQQNAKTAPGAAGGGDGAAADQKRQRENEAGNGTSQKQKKEHAAPKEKQPKVGAQARAEPVSMEVGGKLLHGTKLTVESPVGKLQKAHSASQIVFHESKETEHVTAAAQNNLIPKMQHHGHHAIMTAAHSANTGHPSPGPAPVATASASGGSAGATSKQAATVTNNLSALGGVQFAGRRSMMVPT